MTPIPTPHLTPWHTLTSERQATLIARLAEIPGAFDKLNFEPCFDFDTPFDLDTPPPFELSELCSLGLAGMASRIEEDNRNIYECDFYLAPTREGRALLEAAAIAASIPTPTATRRQAGRL